MSAHRVGAALAVFAAAGLAWAQEQTLLERVREALGEPPAGIIALEGRSTFLGADGRYEAAFDGRGRFRTKVAGELGLERGHDGQTTWEVDWNRMPRVLELGDDDSALLEAWALSGHWARGAEGVELREISAPQPGANEPGADEPGGEGTEGERLAMEMSGGKLKAVVHIDPETWLPSRIVVDVPAGAQTIELSEYERLDGMAIPTEVTVTPPDGQSSTLSITGIATAPADEAGFAPRLERPDDVRFDDAVSPQLEVKRVPTGHLLVHPTINGEDLGWFIFDTGAGSNVLSLGAVESLGLGKLGAVTARGVGGAIETGFYRVDELTIGPMTVEDQAFVGIDLAFLKPHFGVDVAGIVGYDMLTRCIAEFDGAGDAIALYDPQAYAAPEGVTWAPLMLPDRVPVTVARFEGHEAPFRLDTGAAGDTVAFHQPAVGEFGLLEGRQTAPGMAGGVGGMVEMRKGEIASFTLGGHEFQSLPVQFATQRVGVFADPYTAGNVGGVVLGKFRLVFDYPNRRIGFIEREAE